MNRKGRKYKVHAFCVEDLHTMQGPIPWSGKKHNVNIHNADIQNLTLKPGKGQNKYFYTIYIVPSCICLQIECKPNVVCY